MNLNQGRFNTLTTPVGGMEQPTTRSITTLYVSFVEPPTKVQVDGVEDGRKVFANVMNEFMRMFVTGEKITESFADAIQTRTYLSKNKAQENSKESSTSTYPVALCSDGDWGAYLDDKKTGVVYYYNTKTRSSQWEKPYENFPTVVLTRDQQILSDRLKADYLESVYENNLSSAAAHELDWIEYLKNMLSSGMNAVGVVYNSISTYNIESTADISDTNTVAQERTLAVESKTSIKNSLALCTEGDWEAFLDDDQTGFVYYYNTKTQSSQWEKPYESFPTIVLSKKEQATSDRLTRAYFQSVYENDLSSFTSTSFDWIDFIKNILMSGMNSIGAILDTRDAVSAEVSTTDLEQYTLESAKDSLPIISEGVWLAYFDDETTGLVYYYNTITQTSQWEKPYEEFPDVILSSTQEAISKKLQEAYFQTNEEQFTTQPFLAKEGDWKAYLDCSQHTNLVYYYNEVTGQSQWYPPTSTFPSISPHMWLNLMMKNQKPEFVAPLVQDGVWGAFYDYDTSRFFYYNAETGVSQWEIPSPSFPSVFFLSPEPKNKWIESFNTWFQNEAAPWLSSQFHNMKYNIENETVSQPTSELTTDKNSIHQLFDNKVNEAETWWKSLFFVSTTNENVQGITDGQNDFVGNMKAKIEPLSLPSLPTMNDIETLLDDFNSRFSSQLRTFSLKPRTFHSLENKTNVNNKSSQYGFWTDSSSNSKSNSESSRSVLQQKASTLLREENFKSFMNGFSSFELHRLGTFSLSALDRKRKMKSSSSITTGKSIDRRQ